MKNLQVQVFMNETAMKTRHRVFERIVSFNDACVIDFSCIMKALNFLFGDSVIISFNIY